jgi:diguanylate cyclase (GGDEF)-like protein/PAS domain S-box-containing protein
LVGWFISRSGHTGHLGGIGQGLGSRVDVFAVWNTRSAADVTGRFEGLDLVPDAAVVVDDALRVLDANRAAELLFGVGRERWLGRVPLELVHPDDVALVVSSHAEVVHKAVGTPIEVRIRIADGSYRLVEIVGGARETAEGRIVVLTFRDLTERRRWEVAANRPEVFRSLIEYAAVIVALVDRAGIVDSVSGAFTRELGHDPTRVVGHAFAEFVVDQDGESFRTDFDAACARPERSVWVVDLCRADGTSCPFELTVVNLLDDPILAGLIVTAVEISERRRATQELALTARRFEALLDNLSEVVTVIDRQGNMRYLSGSTRRLLGRTVEGRLGRSIFDFVHPDDAGRAAETFMRALDTPGPVEPFDVRMLHEDGEYHVFEVRANNMLDDPAVEGLIVSSRDLTDRRQMEATLSDAEARFEQVFENAAAGATIADATGRFIRVNSAYCRMLGLSAPEILTKTIFDVSLAEDIDRTRVAFERLVTGEANDYTIEKPLRRADGTTIWARICASAVRDEHDALLYTIGLVVDTSETHRLTEQLTHAASHDHLTGLAARSVLVDHLQRCRANATRSGDLVAVLAVDLDGFKQVNDQYGHLAGDQVLIEVAHRLESVVRASDLIVRYGGDEFIIVLHPITDLDAATDIAQRVVDALAEPMDVLGATTRVGASVGIAIAAPDTPDLNDELLAQADAATYEAKQRGKGRYVIFDEQHRVTRPTPRTAQTR